MLSYTGLSYQVILESKSRVLLANCPYEAEPVNSQVFPCNAVSSGACLPLPIELCTDRLCGLLQS